MAITIQVPIVHILGLKANLGISKRGLSLFRYVGGVSSFLKLRVEVDGGAENIPCDTGKRTHGGGADEGGLSGPLAVCRGYN